jgi:hypothetical protein
MLIDVIYMVTQKEYGGHISSLNVVSHLDKTLR